MSTCLQEALAVLPDKLQTHHVALQADTKERLPAIRGERSSSSKCW